MLNGKLLKPTKKSFTLLHYASWPAAAVVDNADSVSFSLTCHKVGPNSVGTCYSIWTRLFLRALLMEIKPIAKKVVSEPKSLGVYCTKELLSTTDC